MTIYRPHIPLAVRIRVVERQLMQLPEWPEIRVAIMAGARLPMRTRLANALHLLFGEEKCHLHHRPALVNRRWDSRANDYDPPANSPEHLIYLDQHTHDIETRVHGIGAQRSDLGQRRYNKRVARNRAKPKRKHYWPTRPLRSANRWPTRP